MFPQLVSLLTGNVRMGMIVWPIVIAVCVNDDRQSAEQIFAAKDRPTDHSVFRIPNSETIAEKIFALSSDFKANDDLPISVPGSDKKHWEILIQLKDKQR